MSVTVGSVKCESSSEWGQSLGSRSRNVCACMRACVRTCTVRVRLHMCVAHRCNVWDVWVEHCPSVMYKEDVKEGKGFHLHVRTGQLVTEADKGTTAMGERVGTPKGRGKGLATNIISSYI